MCDNCIDACKYENFEGIITSKGTIHNQVLVLTQQISFVLFYCVGDITEKVIFKKI